MPPEAPSSPGILRMAAPLVISFWMRALFTFVDTIYASTLGDASVAAIGLSIPFEFLMIAVWVGLSTGLTSNLARAVGAGEGDKVDQHLRVGRRKVLWVIPVFVAIGGACWLLADRIAPSADVAGEFAIYGTVLMGGSAFTLFWSVLPDSIVKAHGDTRATMWAGIWSNVVNLVLNTIFVFVFHWGIFGIGLSTVVGRLAGLAYALSRARAHQRAWRARGQHTEPGLDPTPYLSQFRLSIPSAASFCLMASEAGIVNAFLVGLPDGTEAVAAYGIFYRVFQFGSMPVIASAVAMLPFAARRFGANDLPGVRSGIRILHLAGLAYTAVAAPILWFTAAPIARALTESPVARQYATFGMRVVPLAALASISFFICRPVFEAMGRGRPGLAMSILRYAILTAPAAFVGAHIGERLGYPSLNGILIGLVVAAALVSAAFLAWTVAMLRGVERQEST